MIADPVRAPQTRAGNGMGRSRAAAVAGARRVLVERGVRKTTMGEVAVRGGLAKATLYNHVRTKDELLLLVAAEGLERVRAAASSALGSGDLTTGLTAAAAELAGDEVLIALRRSEPAALLPLAAPGDGAGWDRARAATSEVLAAGGRTPDPAAVDLTLRWLTSHVLSPGRPAERAAAARALAALLPVEPRRTNFADPRTG